MRKSLAALSVIAWGLLTIAVGAPAVGASSTKGRVVISHVTVTAANAHGNSAVSMTITNDSKDTISLFSVTSPETKTSMIDYDTNMCQGNHAMMELANILIVGGHTQQLGYKYQGAMLRRLKEKIVKGETIPVVVTWSNFSKAESVTVEAKVIAPPKYLNFGMSSMDM
ncbi:MAG: copper chaperone PCu(A)C [Acidimicrobiales bacterium]